MDKGEITTLLQDFWTNDQARGQLYEKTQDALLQRAQSLLAKELNTRSVSAQDLLSESFLRIFCGVQVPWNGKAHFYAFTYLAMKRVLIEHARRKAALKRGAAKGDVQVRDDDAAAPDVLDESLAWVDALEQLAREDELLGLVTGMYYCEGLSFEEIARQLNAQGRLDPNGEPFTADTIEGLIDLAGRKIRKYLRNRRDAS